MPVLIVFVFFQKNPRVRKICVRNSGAGNGCANFMDAWKNAFFLQETHVHKIPRFRGGFGGGGSADFIFMGARIFLIFSRGQKTQRKLFFYQSFSTTLRVMDVPRRKPRTSAPKKCVFPAAPVVGRNFLTPGPSGVRVRNVRRKSGPKSFMFYAVFFFP